MLCAIHNAENLFVAVIRSRQPHNGMYVAVSPLFYNADNGRKRFFFVVVVVVLPSCNYYTILTNAENFFVTVSLLYDVHCSSMRCFSLSIL